MAGPTARSYPNGAVASPHYLATAAGAAMLARGGNAMDAAIAANLVLGVVTPYYCGAGGDVLAMVWDGAVHGYAGIGRSAEAASVDQVRLATGGDDMPVFGAHAVTVPGAVAGWFDLLLRWGSRDFGEVAAAAITYADDGFVLTARGAELMEGTGALYDHFGLVDFSRAYPDREAGAWIRQPALGAALRLLARDGPDAYYRGPIGAAIVERLERAGGVMSAADLAAHEGAWVAPLSAPYRDVEVLELPPPTQGVTALEALRIVDGFELAPATSVDRQHLLVEAAKAALVDRNREVGDPAAMRVSAATLLGDEWIARRRAGIDPARAAVPPADPGADGGTAYLCAADRDGLLVSLIQTNFTAAGCGLRVEEHGINLHNRGSSFRLRPGHVNALAGSKLPMHTLIPALVQRDGRPWLVFGTMGGHTQAQTHLQLLAHLVDDGADAQAAIDAPRFSLDPDHWHLDVETRFDPALLDGLRARGHDVRTTRAYHDGMGHAHAIEVLGPGYRVATDPRAEGAASGL